MSDALGELKKTIEETIQEAAGDDALFGVSEDAGQGWTPRSGRPRLLVVSFYALNEKIQEIIRAFSTEEKWMVYWPLYCGKGPFGSKMSSLRMKVETAAPAGDPLPWKDWLAQAIKIIQPRDLLLLGEFSQIKEFPLRPECDHKTRGRAYVPFVCENLPRYDREQEDYLTHLAKWSRAFREDWFGQIMPHFKEQYNTGVAIDPQTGKRNAFAALTGYKRTTNGASKGPKKESKLPRVE